ncbi:hypothetical protein [Mesorhizobium sp. YM1C-6-2]|uniref:hypothetical protein n=1 Tax=Mesorhizobium sp. YM1C-6-2 TaxID=1827501 RepID=UPI000EF28BAE|nr:hypothetical protein [Mesorhizobium sp. YM1C-6-2]RLP27599.1 hypothetical protein D8676_00025 [Mesorhizobium sp. YM1C-6-2]
MRSDPIAENYYKPLIQAEVWSDFLFYLAAATSIAAMLVSGEIYPTFNGLIQIVFVISVIFIFVIGVVNRLYLSPRAEEKRREDLLSNSFDVNLTHENTVGYFNNDQKNPIKRLAASVMESSYFTAKITKEMLFRERLRVGIYSIIWLVSALLRTTDLSIIAVGAQVLFGEQILFRWFRLEWLRHRSEQTYKAIQRLLTTARTLNKPSSHAQVLEWFAIYETSKSNASMTLSNRIFQKRNEALSQDWEKIRRGLGL